MNQVIQFVTNNHLKGHYGSRFHHPKKVTIAELPVNQQIETLGDSFRLSSYNEWTVPSIWYNVDASEIRSITR